MKKTYIVCTNFAHPCAPSALALGHILDNPFDWAPAPRNRDCHVPIPSSNVSHTLMKEGLTAKRMDLATGKDSAGVWGQFLARFRGVGPRPPHSDREEEDDLVRIETLETTEFEPSMEYVTQSVAGRSVRDDVEERGGEAVLYMVTGMKVVKGASVGRVEDGTVQWTEPMDFVLAIRVGKLCVDEWDVDVRHSDRDGEAMNGEGAVKGRRAVEFGGDLTMKDLDMMLGEEYTVIGDTEDDIRWVV
ncbi:hypothetical protein QBC47DRAFT_395481 [Echria macrotheca]|uniref:Uncharacterized protein n=1 Tax=Echria macrotheca TaxID=438768 RepID=A0AAJ0F3S8_9PEZI|nr:hypothetical protein QBC47DRAFT_395481 [Echria macrotheca]